MELDYDARFCFFWRILFLQTVLFKCLFGFQKTVPANKQINKLKFSNSNQSVVWFGICWGKVCSVNVAICLCFPIKQSFKGNLFDDLREQACSQTLLLFFSTNKLLLSLFTIDIYYIVSFVDASLTSSLCLSARLISSTHKPTFFATIFKFFHLMLFYCLFNN